MVEAISPPKPLVLGASWAISTFPVFLIDCQENKKKKLINNLRGKRKIQSTRNAVLHLLLFLYPTAVEKPSRLLHSSLSVFLGLN